MPVPRLALDPVASACLAVSADGLTLQGDPARRAWERASGSPGGS